MQGLSQTLDLSTRPQQLIKGGHVTRAGPIRANLKGFENLIFFFPFPLNWSGKEVRWRDEATLSSGGEWGRVQLVFQGAKGEGGRWAGREERDRESAA